MTNPTTTIGHLASRTTASAAPSCTTAVPGKYGEVPPDACNANYNFDPSFAGNLAFAVLFALCLAGQLVQAFVYKKRFCWVIIMGAIWETGAFILRTLGAHAQQNQQYSLWGTLLFLLAPLWINAFVYMTVARLVHFGLPEKKIWGIPGVKMTKTFVWLDVVCFLIQAVGGAMLSGQPDANTLKIGKSIYMTGIGVQMVFIFVFSALTISFYREMLKVYSGRIEIRMKLVSWAMLAVLGLVVLRIIYRLAEFGPGVSASNPLLGHEIYPFMLDGFPMLVALVLLNVLHPGLVLRGPDSEFPRVTRAEKKALKAQKKDEKAQKKAAKKAGKLGQHEMTGGFYTGVSRDSDSDTNVHEGTRPLVV